MLDPVDRLLWQRKPQVSEPPYQIGLDQRVNSPDPPLTAVGTAYAPPPLLTFFDPPINLASLRPRGCLDLDGRIDLSTISLGTLLHFAVAEILVGRGPRISEMRLPFGSREPPQAARFRADPSGIG
jgi:hypothetical protein